MLEEDPLTDRATKIRKIRERMELPMTADLRAKLEAKLAELSSEEPLAVNSPPEVAPKPSPPAKKLAVEPTEPLPVKPETIKVWTPSGYIEVVRQGGERLTQKASKSDAGGRTVDAGGVAEVPVESRLATGATPEQAPSRGAPADRGAGAAGGAGQELLDSLSRIAALRPAEESKGKVETYELPEGAPAQTVSTHGAELYKTIFATWRSQVDSYWQRSNYFAVAETAALAGCWYIVEHHHPWPGLLFSLLGITLTIVWFLSSVAVHRYIDYWWKSIMKIEAKLSLRDEGFDFVTKHPGSRMHASILAKIVPGLFLAAWIVILSFSIYCLCCDNTMYPISGTERL